MANVVNPYENASIWDTLTRKWYSNSEEIKTCALSNRKIEIPNRKFTIKTEQGRVDYDIYELALDILRKSAFVFPGANADFQRFLKTFNLGKGAFMGLWGKDFQVILKAHIKNHRPDVPSASDFVKASIRIHLFADAISKSQQKILAHYTVLDQHFKEILKPKSSGCLDYDDGC